MIDWRRKLFGRVGVASGTPTTWLGRLLGAASSVITPTPRQVTFASWDTARQTFASWDAHLQAFGSWDTSVQAFRSWP